MATKNNLVSVNKLLLFLIIIFGLVIVYFIFSKNNLISQQNISAIETPTPTIDNFAKKNECKKLETQFVKEMQDNNLSSIGVVISLYRVFYSSSRNSCMAATYTLDSKNDKEILQIDDISNGEKRIFYKSYENSMKYWDAEAILDTEIAKLE